MKNTVIKAWVSSLFGFAIMAGTSVLIYKGSMKFIWEGLIGISLGFAIFMMPARVEKAIGEILRNILNIIPKKNEN